MAFSAALSGGVALQSELTEKTEGSSRAAKTLRGSLGLFGGAGLGGAAEKDTVEGQSAESTLVRKHTIHSIFMALHEDLRVGGRLLEEPPISDLRIGDLVSLELKPAIAPLRRVIEQVLRLLDVMSPIMGLDESEHSAPRSRQERRQRARQAANAAAAPSSDDDGLQALAGLRALFTALRDDLEQSGMVDVVVTAEDSPGVILTLDKRFADSTALELLHTSSFTVVGKVTQTWPADEAVLLYRRSSLSLVPALSGQVMVGVLGFLFSMAKAVGSVDIQSQLAEILTGGSDSSNEADERVTKAAGHGDASSDGRTDVDEDRASEEDLRVGNDVDALNPILNGPAVQILPLALCV
ncbi:MAG TPA: hypothetical protein VFT50_01415 [Baekduia sp.]|nr:hypothetical protein [Baekduia sp.]